MAVIQFGEKRAGGAKRLALDLRVEEIALYVHTTAGSWREEAVAQFDGDNLGTTLAALRDRAAELVRSGPPPVDVWLPAEQVLSVESDEVGLGASEAEARIAIERAIAAGTSVPLDDLTYDLAPASAGWAASAAERAVVAEATSYVEQWGFAPQRITTRFGHPAFAAGPTFAPAPKTSLPIASSKVFALLGGAALAASIAAFAFLGGGEEPTPPAVQEQVAQAEAPDNVAAAPASPGDSATVENALVEDAPEDEATALPEPRGPISVELIGVLSPPQAVVAALGAPDLTRAQPAAKSQAAAAATPAPWFSVAAETNSATNYRLFLAAPERDGAERDVAPPATLSAIERGTLAPEALARPPETEPGAPLSAAAQHPAAPPTEAPPPPRPVADAETDEAIASVDALSDEATPPDDGLLTADPPSVVEADDLNAATETALAAEDAADPETLPEVAEEDIPGPGAVASAPSPRGRPDALDMTASETVARNAPTPASRPKSIRPRPKTVAAASATGARTARAPSRGPPDGPGVANAATLKNAMRLEEMNLLGVFGSKGSRRALLRLPNGEIMRVSQGAVIDGWMVSRIDAKSLRITRGGQAETLNIVR